MQQNTEPVQLKASQSCLVMSRANYTFVEEADRRLLVRKPSPLHLCGDVTAMVVVVVGGSSAVCKRCCYLPNMKLTRLFMRKKIITFHCKSMLLLFLLCYPSLRTF